MKKLLLLAIVVLGISAVSFGQVASSVTKSDNNATATIIAPINLQNTTPLNFGTIGAKATASTVILAADGSRGGTADRYVGTSSATAASFKVTGTPDASFVITKPAGNEELTGQGAASGAPKLTITDWICSAPLTTKLESNGEKIFTLTGTLNIGASATQTPGVYNGTYEVTVNYN